MKIQDMKKVFKSILTLNEGYRELEKYEFRSSDSWKCSRCLFLKKKFPDREIKPDQLGLNRFFMGNASHKYVQEIIEKIPEMENRAIMREAAVNRTFALPQAPNFKIKVTAHADILYSEPIEEITDLPKVWEGCIELKSASSWAYERGMQDSKPSKHHYYQSNWNAWLLDVPEHYIVYMNKQAGYKEPSTFNIYRNDTDALTAKATLDRQFHVAKCLDLPMENIEAIKLALPCTKFTWECGYCETRDVCKEFDMRPPKGKSGTV